MIFVATAFWRSGLDPDEPVDRVEPAGSAGVAEHFSPGARLSLGDLALRRTERASGQPGCTTVNQAQPTSSESL
jgi:hypothetical protein